MNPIFPVVLDYDDGDLAWFASFDEFLESSGCEEEDFERNGPPVVDSRRRCFRFSYRCKAFAHLDGVEPSPAAARLLTQ